MSATRGPYAHEPAATIAAPERSIITMLFFVACSTAPDDGFFADRVTEEPINGLAQGSDPKVAFSSRVGRRLVGSTKTTLRLNAHWRPPPVKGVSFDVGTANSGDRVATRQSRRHSRTDYRHVGGRYQFKLGPAATREGGAWLSRGSRSYRRGIGY